MTGLPRRLRRPTEYDLHRALGKPRQLWMRRKERHREPLAIAYLEAGRYRRTVYRFIAARIEDPSIMYNFDNLTSEGLAVDVGAFEGKWSREVHARHGCAIDAFELSPEFFGVLDEVAAEVPGMRVHEYGLGRADETVKVSMTHLGSSVFDSPRSGDDTTWIDGRLRDVAEVWSELCWDRVAVMKLNIEGGEYDVLDRLIETGLHARIDTIFVQFHEWIPGAYSRRRAIRRALRATHDEQWCYPWVWEKWTRKT
jgi:FkbM family methyltransferase